MDVRLCEDIMKSAKIANISSPIEVSPTCVITNFFKLEQYFRAILFKVK